MARAKTAAALRRMWSKVHKRSYSVQPCARQSRNCLNVLAAVAVAERMRARCVPVFWANCEQSHQAEAQTVIRYATDRSSPTQRRASPRRSRRETPQSVEGTPCLRRGKDSPAGSWHNSATRRGMPARQAYMAAYAAGDKPTYSGNHKLVRMSFDIERDQIGDYRMSVFFGGNVRYSTAEPRTARQQTMGVSSVCTHIHAYVGAIQQVQYRSSHVPMNNLTQAVTTVTKDITATRNVSNANAAGDMVFYGVQPIDTVAFFQAGVLPLRGGRRRRKAAKCVGRCHGPPFRMDR